MSVYIVVENGEPYLIAFKSFASASAAVGAKYRETIEEELKEAGGPICSDIDLPEHVSGITHLYVEKGINVIIYKVPLVL